jgi:hypothetical protein
VSIEQLTTLVALVGALSVAAERIVAIFKGFVPFLATKIEVQPQAGEPAPTRADVQKAAEQEARRQVWIQILTIFAGIAVAFLAQPIFIGLVPETWSPVGRVIGLGILASGGSTFWNDFSGWVYKVKEARDAQAAKEEAERAKLLAEKEHIEVDTQENQDTLRDRNDRAPGGT